MTERGIDAANEGGGSAPFLLAETCGSPSLCSLSSPASAAQRLASTPTDKLKEALTTVMKRKREFVAMGTAVADGLPPLNIDMGLLLGAELTRRKVPPIFRATPYYCSDDPTPPWWHDKDSDHLALLLDVQWLVHWHPHPNPGAWEGAAKVYNPAQYRSTCRWLHWNGRRSGGQAAKALALTEAQQFELTYAHALYVARQKRATWSMLPIARAKIKSEIDQRSHDRRDTRSRDETATRRADLWLCGAFADRKPQRTAEMYELLTGQSVARSIVARHLERMPVLRRKQRENLS